MKTNPDYTKTVYETCENCIYNSTGDTTGTRAIGHPKCDPCRRYSNFAYKDRKDLFIRSEDLKSAIVQGKTDKAESNVPVFDIKIHKMAETFLRPPHYQNNWDVARFADSRGYDLYQFNVLKYIDRHSRKDGKKDLLKALDYLQEYINVRYPEEK